MRWCTVSIGSGQRGHSLQRIEHQHWVERCCCGFQDAPAAMQSSRLQEDCGFPYEFSKGRNLAAKEEHAVECGRFQVFVWRGAECVLQSQFESVMFPSISTNIMRSTSTKLVPTNNTRATEVPHGSQGERASPARQLMIDPKCCAPSLGGANLEIHKRSLKRKIAPSWQI